MPSFNLADLFETVVDAVPERLALVAGDVRLSYRGLDARANRLANHLQSQGIGAGDNVAIHAFNRAEWVEAMLACFKLAAVPVNINYRYLETELRYILQDADIRAVIHELEFTDLIGAVRDAVPTLQTTLALDADYEQALASQSGLRPAAQRSDQDHYMLYTGGTTGMPKGTLWYHRDIFYGALQGGNPGGEPITEPVELGPLATASANPYASLCPAPMMHGGGMWYCLIYLLSGNTFVLYTDRHFDAHRLLQLAERERAANLIVVGDAMARPLAEALSVRSYDLSGLFVIGSGGAILSPAVKQQLRSLLPNTLIFDSFGASETGSAGVVLDAGDETVAGPRFTVSANVAVLDEQTLEPLPPGSEREGMLAKSGHIPFAYYKDEAKTAATFRTDSNGVRWVLPGDRARVLEDGRVELLGRGSMCINSGGEKIFPEEVEATLKGHPDIFDAAVVGVPDHRFGNRVVALLQLREGKTLEPAELDSWCRTQLAGYKCPRQWLLLAAVPRTPAGKPDYRALQALAEAASEA
ncbi:MAG: acyl-CoA synthetase [Haliea sp.]